MFANSIVDVACLLYMHHETGKVSTATFRLIISKRPTEKDLNRGEHSEHRSTNPFNFLFKGPDFLACTSPSYFTFHYYLTLWACLHLRTQCIISNGTKLLVLS